MIEPLPIEPAASNVFLENDTTQHLLASIAISLKRIADALTGDEGHRGMADMMADLVNRPSI